MLTETQVVFVTTKSVLFTEVYILISISPDWSTLCTHTRTRGKTHLICCTVLKVGKETQNVRVRVESVLPVKRENDST